MAPLPAGDLAALSQALAGARVLVVGDVMLDRFVHGTVDRVSPEAPIAVLRAKTEHAMPGAAGNVAANLSALGALPRLAGVVGDDAEGRELTQRLGEGARLVVEPGRPTTVKTRFGAGSQQLLRVDRETVQPIGAAAGRSLAEIVTAAAADAGAIILSDYAKGTLTAPVLAAAFQAAAGAGIPAIVDPKGRDFGRYRGAGILTPNRRELAEAIGMAVGDDAALVAAARRLLAETGARALVVTRSEEGLSVITAEGEPLHLRAQAREVFDVSGAGDTVVAVLAAALAAGGALADAARLANLAGGLVVAKAGTAVISAAELAAAIHLEAWRHAEDKIADLATAALRVADWRRRGLTVGFTNGCFDLLHPGHLSLLRQARAACGRLVVGLNTDASVRRLKGPERPVQPEAARAQVLAALEAVDLVVPFGEDTPLAVLERLRPDLLVKGEDYAIDQVVGADLVQGYGGRVLLAALEPGFSTTATIRKLRL